MTPLHVLTARAIARERDVRFSCGVYASAVEDEKCKEYSERMKQFCDRVQFVKMKTDFGSGFAKYGEIIKGRRAYIRRLRALGVFDACYLPSSLSDYVYAVPSSRSMDIYTYDDGVLNIHPDRLINKRDRSFGTRMLLALSGIRYWPERIKRETRKHFTLYGIENIYPRAEKISLFDVPPSTDSGESGGVHRKYNLVLGPSPEFDTSAVALLGDFCRNRAMDGFLAHPRWKGPGLSGVPTVTTKLIAEDFVLSLIANGYTSVDVFGLESSALINLVGVPGVRCFTLLEPGGSSDAIARLMIQAGVEVVEE